MNINKAVFSDRIKKMRHRRNMTQEELAEKADLSVVFVSHLETGKRLPSLDKAIDICNALGCTMDELFDGFLTAKKQAPQPKLVQVLSDCTNAERKALLRTLEAFKDYLKDSL